MTKEEIDGMVREIEDATIEVGYDAKFSQDHELKKYSIETLNNVYNLLKRI